MQVSFKIDFSRPGREELINKTVDVTSLDINLIDTMDNNFGEDEGWVFSNYYDNEALMVFERCFPFILTEKGYEWVVPFEEVTIRDFIRTHNLKEDKPVIQANVGCYGGDFDDCITEIVDWIIFGWPMVINGIITIGGLFAFGDYIGKIVKYFTNKYNKRPIPSDVADMIKSKRSWNIDELQSVLDIDDKDFVEKLLFCCGFHNKNNSPIYKRNKNAFRRMHNNEFDYISDCWGPGADSHDDEDPYGEIKDNVQSINIVMTDIKMHSTINNSDCFEIAEHEIDLLANEYGCVRKGKFFRFLTLNEFLIKNEKDSLEADLSKTLDFLKSLLMYLSEKEDAKNNKILITE